MISSIEPNSTITATAVWNNPTQGQYKIFAIVDPNDVWEEADGTNNMASQEVTVNPPVQDTTPPVITGFTINQGQQTTSGRQVLFNTTAIDPGSMRFSSGVTNLLFIEFVYDTNINDWQEVQRTGWLPYDTVGSNYPWRLTPDVGLRYIQVYAADRSGNTSTLPFEGFINFLPTLPSLAAGQTHLFRLDLQAGQAVTLTLTSLGGMADLYVWDPTWTSGSDPLVMDESNMTVKTVSFTAPAAGLYQVEVEALTTTFYQLLVEISTDDGRAPMEPQGIYAPFRGRVQPLINVVATPSNYVGLPSPESNPNFMLFLPLIVR